MRHPGLEALQWFGLFAGPLAFALEHVVGLAASLAQCSPAGSRWSVEPHVVQLAAISGAVVVILAGEVAALLAFRGTREIDLDGDPPQGRIHFLAAAALVLGPVFLTLVLLTGIGAVAQPDCSQA